MPSRLVNDFEETWTSSDPARLHGTPDPFRLVGDASLLVTTTGADGAVVEFTPAETMDLTDFDELRFSISLRVRGHH